MSILADLSASPTISAWLGDILLDVDCGQFDVFFLVQFQFEFFVFAADAVEQFHRFGLLRDALASALNFSSSTLASAVPSFSIGHGQRC